MASQVKLIENIAGTISKSNLVKVGLGEAVNMFVEQQQNSNEKSTSLVMRSAMGEVLAQNITGKCRGMYRVSRGYDNKPVLYAVYDTTLYLIDSNNNAISIGTINSYTTECHMTETGGYGSAHPHLIIVDGTSVYAVNTGLSIGDQQLDLKRIDLPYRVNSTTEYIKPTHCAYLYGYLIVNDAGTDAFYTSYQYPFEISNSESDSFYEEREQFITWWTGLDDATKEQYKSGQIQDQYYTEYKDFIDGNADDTPEVNDIFRVHTVEFANYGFITYSEWCPDNTIALCSNGSKLYTFGERSWQVFSYNDDKNNPFTSPDNAAGNVGIKAPNSLAMLGNTVLWLANSDIGDNGVFMIKDTELTRISTQDIERELTQLANLETGYASIWQEHQHVFYSLTFEDAKKTYVYDVTENAWHYRASYDSKNHLTYWRYNHATYAYSKIYVGTTNALAYMDENKYTEHDGKVIYKMRRGSVLTSNDQPFYIDSAEIICNNGQLSFDNHYDNIEMNPRISIRYSWDGATFSDYEDYYMGKLGRYDYSTVIWQLGMGSYFTLEVSTTEPIPFAIENLKVAYSPTSMF
ncbi:MAG: hypothetical protein IKG84_07010 [Bacteroidales bacterium]|nr:hypothetical protein [Bacteroidales bacterium]